MPADCTMPAGWRQGEKYDEKWPDCPGSWRKPYSPGISGVIFHKDRSTCFSGSLKMVHPRGMHDFTICKLEGRGYCTAESLAELATELDDFWKRLSGECCAAVSAANQEALHDAYEGWE